LQIVYIIIAVTAWFYPNTDLTTSNGRSATDAAEAVVRAAKMLMP
jgi:hypothetical protein